mgnify:CR=1 FL=1
MDRRWIPVAAALALGGCATSSVPDPKVAAAEYAQAASRGDADAIYEMMTVSAKRSRSRDEVRKIVKDERDELAEQARALASKEARVEATAHLAFDDGEKASLELDRARPPAAGGHRARIRGKQPRRRQLDVRWPQPQPADHLQPDARGNRRGRWIGMT